MLEELLREQSRAIIERWTASLRDHAIAPPSSLELERILAGLTSQVAPEVAGIELDVLIPTCEALHVAIADTAHHAGLALRSEDSYRVTRFLFETMSAASASRTRRARTPSMTTLREHAEELAILARTSQAQLRLVIDALPFLISFVTHDERYGLVNRAYEEWFGVPKEDIIGRRLVEVVGEAAYERLRPLVLRGLAGERFTFEQRAVPYSSGKRDIRATFVPQTEAGKVTGYVALLEDISWRLQLEAEREVMAHERADTLAKQAAFERQLIGIVSHDLRNPLNVVTLGGKLLVETGELSPIAAKHAHRVLNAADRAGRLVGDLLDFTQARQGGGLQIEREAGDLRSIVQSVIEEVQASYPGRRIEVQQQRNGVGMWDADRIGQVIQNLVTNACKYSPPDSTIEVLVSETPDQVMIRVHNLGDPIPADKLPILFEPYERAAALTSLTNRSVGLGLYIVKLIVEAHGGTVAVDSGPTVGTTFLVTLPRTTNWG